jgi:Zn-dependent metalloprotease
LKGWKKEEHMHQQEGHRHSIFCILPPDVLLDIAQTGTEEEREAALNTLAADSTFRTLRAIRLAAPVAATAQADVTVPGQKRRTIYDCKNRMPDADEQVDQARAEAEPATNDSAVDEAFDGLGDTYDCYLEMFNRNSIDDQGMPLEGYVHYGRRYNNAFWDGQRMVFGDGDGVLLNRFTIAVDVMGHELTHGVTEKEAQLIYRNQSGALNESISDVFGSLVKQFRNGRQAAENADWLIGEGLFADPRGGKALRSMKDPGSAHERDRQPEHMRDYVNTIEDNGGVHINSGIPNKAFYLAATEIGGFAGDKAARVWYAALRDPRLKPNAKFVDFAQLTFLNAWNLFPAGREAEIVRDAWAQVGVEWESQVGSATRGGERREIT